jgi:hypothetical protein
MGTRSRSRLRRPRATSRAAGALLLLALACDGQRRASDGSTLEGPRVWTGGVQQWVSGAPLPADTLSVTLMAKSDPQALLSLEISTTDRLLVEAREPELSPNRMLRGRGLVTAMIPSATASLPLAPDFQVTPVALDGGSADAVTVSAWIKRGPTVSVPAVQALPIAVLLVGGAQAPALDVALGELGRIWRAAGIEISDPTILRVEGPARVEVDAALGSDSPMVGQALALSQQAPAGTLALVVVSDLALGTQGLWALSGGIPVPPVNGTTRSGVLVSAALLGRDPLWGGQIVAHEVGHALGLYHTTERSLVPGAIEDQLDDTPSCPAEADRNGNGVLEATECQGRDAANLMFWATARGATALTAQQAAQARRSALVR